MVATETLCKELATVLSPSLVPGEGVCTRTRCLALCIGRIAQWVQRLQEDTWSA